MEWRKRSKLFSSSQSSPAGTEWSVPQLVYTYAHLPQQTDSFVKFPFRVFPLQHPATSSKLILLATELRLIIHLLLSSLSFQAPPPFSSISLRGGPSSVSSLHLLLLPFVAAPARPRPGLRLLPGALLLQVEEGQGDGGLRRRGNEEHPRHGARRRDPGTLWSFFRGAKNCCEMQCLA